MLASAGRGAAGGISASGYLREFARCAEGLGFDSLWLPDHVVLPARYESRYPYQRYEDRDFKGYPYDETAFPEPLPALAYVAGATERIQLMTGVLILPERNPVLFAKQLATLDRLSDGRLELGVGIGWLREEYWASPGRGADRDPGSVTLSCAAAPDVHSLRELAGCGKTPCASANRLVHA